MQTKPIIASDIPATSGVTFYPEPFAKLVAGRTKRKLGDIFGLSNLGINLTHLSPGASSTILHHHAKQDEFIYVLEGQPTLILGYEEFGLTPGACVGFKAGSGIPHQLQNRSGAVAAYLEIGDRSPGDVVEYPNDDIKAVLAENGTWKFTHKDGAPY